VSATPEDLIETWHLVTGNGDEPVEWQMDEAMWAAVRESAKKNGASADDPQRTEKSLLGTPVEITRTTVPILRYRRNGELFGTPILGPGSELSAAQRHAHSTFPSRPS
jgi:hypothetical protein